MGDRSKWLSWIALVVLTTISVGVGPSGSSPVDAPASIGIVEPTKPVEPVELETALLESTDEDDIYAIVEDWLDAEPLAQDEPNKYGDDDYFDGLWDQCEAGSGSACESLFQISPVGSDYERFGVSCGERPGIVDCRTQLIDGVVIPYSQRDTFIVFYDVEITTVPG